MPGDLSGLTYRLAAIALALGVASGMGHGVAWADGGESDPAPGAVHTSQTGDTAPSSKADGAATTGPEDPGTAAPDPEPTPGPTKPAGSGDDPAATPESSAQPDSDEADPEAEDPPAAAEDADPEVPTTTAPEITPAPPADPVVVEPVVAEPLSDPAVGKVADGTDVAALPAARSADEAPSAPAETSALSVRSTAPDTSVLETTALQTAALETTKNTPASAAVPQTVTKALVTVTTPSAPEPLSPLAELLELPGRIVNAVLEVFGFTTSSDGNKGPFTLAPVMDLLFAVFRGVERLFGLDRTPAVQPVVPALTYTGPPTGETPTVAQFLNAAAAEYVLGGVPGGLVPFTVNGFQMATLNIFSGAAARVWVTPERQVIIAYQGTTGGTNLLFKPIMVVSQLLADLQVILTNTTPWAFYDALNFARQVQAEAAKQGYGADDIFVTGHSLGGWEAEYVAQQTGLRGIGFESPGINTTTPGNGAGSGFVNIETYGDTAAYMSTDLPGLQPFMPEYVPGGGSKPHYGAIVMIGDPAATAPLFNASALWGKGLLGTLIFIGDFLGNFFAHHLPGIQAYHLGVTPDPGVVTWLGTATGPVNNGWGELTIPELMVAASDARALVKL